MTPSDDFARALEHYRPPSPEATPGPFVEGERADLLARFPVQGWTEMRLEDYALGSDTQQPSYCQMMEYRTQHLGSIKGGSARKHIIYRPRNGGEWWLPGSLAGMDPYDAWERLRAEFVAAIGTVRDERPDDLDGFELLRLGPALVTKTLAIYAPEHFLRVYSAEHIRRFITHLGEIPEPNAITWVLNRQLKHLVETTEPLASWNQDEVMHFFYSRLDPRDTPEQVYKIAPGEQARKWDECRDGGVIRVGFEEIGDLREFAGADDLLAAVERAFPDKAGTFHKKLTRQLIRFRDFPAGTRIVANRGTREVLAVGTVTDDGYRFDPTLSDYRHVLGVEWDTSYAQKLNTPASGWISTFNNVTPELWATIVNGRSPVGAPGEPVMSGPPVPTPPDVARLLATLERKGQVIVYGPPGTGKTRLALTAALVLTGRGNAIGRGPAARAAAVADMLSGGAGEDDRPVVLTSFHPSMGYEDFVEGFKPVPTKHGGLALERTDGLFLRVCSAARRMPDTRFVLIVDEINRADLARVLGELITLLELDKRESVSVRLPVGGGTFAVPANVRIIGTMNTADRSVAHLDAAVRRRFGFIPVPPDPTLVEAPVGPLNVATFLSELNNRIIHELDRDHQLGHAHLMRDDAPVDSPEALAAAFYQDVVPQLEDYALGDPDLMRRMLGSELIDPAGDVVVHDPQELPGVLATEFAAADPTTGV